MSVRTVDVILYKHIHVCVYIYIVSRNHPQEESRTFLLIHNTMIHVLHCIKSFYNILILQILFEDTEVSKNVIAE